MTATLGHLGPYTSSYLAAELTHGGHARSYPTGAAQTVVVPPLPTGQHMLRWMEVDNHPPDARWDEPSFLSAAPWVCEFRDVLVHGEAGIVCVGGRVIEDTLGQTDPARHHYARTQAGVMLDSARPPTPVAGTCLSLLNFSHDNYFHWTIDTIGRLASADAATLAQGGDVLVPAFTTEFQAIGYDLTGLGRSHGMRTVAPDETLWIERMLVPWNIAAVHRPHPRLRTLFDGIAEAASPGPGPWPRRIYIDRRGSPLRRLDNEDDVVRMLERHGFVAVPLERYSLIEQIGLFAHAELIAGPHGAGLANLVYARPGCRVIELHMPDWMNWCYRRLAAALTLDYDCAVGRVASGAENLPLHLRNWEISLTHVEAAVAAAVER